MQIGKDLVAASATPLVLSLLARGEDYGYSIIKQVKEISGGKLAWTDGMLYPVLHRLERQGLIASRWRVSETGRRRKYYRLKDKGGRALKERRVQWRAVIETLQRMWGAEACSI